MAALVACVLVSACSGTDEVTERVQDAGSEVLATIDDSASRLDDDATTLDESASRVAVGLRAAGLETIASAVAEVDVAALAGSDEFTFFAPDDDAFLSLGADELADLTADPDRLAAVLRAHLVDRSVTAEELATLDEVTTVDGGVLPVVVDGDTVTVGDAEVLRTDVAVGDGRAHVVDAILGPR